MTAGFFAAAFFAVACISASAHGPLSESIAAVSAEIAREPNRIELYLSRARLHLQHEDWPAAQADLDRVAVSAPGSAVDLLRGEVFLKSADFARAGKVFTELIGREPRSVAAHSGLARVQFAMGEFEAAARSFARAADVSEQPDPMLFISQSSAFEKAGRTADAIAALDAGMRRLGPLVSLASPAIELELSTGRTDAAVARIDALLAGQPRKEAWLVRRAEILQKAGRAADARVSWEQARAAFATLPEFRQNTPQMAAIRSRIDAALAK